MGPDAGTPAPIGSETPRRFTDYPLCTRYRLQVVAGQTNNRIVKGSFLFNTNGVKPMEPLTNISLAAVLAIVAAVPTFQG